MKKQRRFLAVEIDGTIESVKFLSRCDTATYADEAFVAYTFSLSFVTEIDIIQPTAYVDSVDVRHELYLDAFIHETCVTKVWPKKVNKSFREKFNVFNMMSVEAFPYLSSAEYNNFKQTMQSVFRQPILDGDFEVAVLKEQNERICTTLVGKARDLLTFISTNVIPDYEDVLVSIDIPTRTFTTRINALAEHSFTMADDLTYVMYLKMDGNTMMMATPYDQFVVERSLLV
jgi:hypothetical protein